MAFAMYKPKPGKRDELLGIVRGHVPTLREYGMATERSSYIAESVDGTVIEVFEWVSEEAKKAAHEHPAVAKIWERMYGAATFSAMRDLPENDKPFPDFTTIG